MLKKINATSVTIDGEDIEVEKNPKYNRGTAAKKVETFYRGNGVGHCVSTNIENAIGMVVITLRTTQENVKLYQEWFKSSGVEIFILDKETGWNITFKDMVIEEDIEIDFESDMEITFKGSQGV